MLFFQRQKMFFQPNFVLNDEMDRMGQGVSVRPFTESVYEVVLQKSIPAQIRQLILFIINNKG